MENIENIIRKNIKDILKNKGMTQIKLAKALNMTTPAQLNDYLKGRVSILNIIDRICKALDVPAWRLTIDKEIKTPIHKTPDEQDMLHILRENEIDDPRTLNYILKDMPKNKEFYRAISIIASAYNSEMPAIKNLV